MIEENERKILEYLFEGVDLNEGSLESRLRILIGAYNQEKLDKEFHMARRNISFIKGRRVVNLGPGAKIYAQ